MTERSIPYQPIDLAEPAELVSAIRKRRGGQFINLDRMLLHSVPIAEGWNHFIGEIRNNLSLDPKLRELAMCGVAVLNGAEYEFFHHAPPFKKAGGTEEQVQALRLIGQPNFPRNEFTPLENDAADLTLQMTRNIQVDPELMKRLQKALGNTDTVELVTVIAAYNMVSRFLIALDIHPEDHPPTS
ncbi:MULTISPECIES: carboxymuconolactone decarboxylase family protein [unclassified Polynucleobacter]|uniref:carboxymuconolactone decarboxylase family protein n=1 Tax=unclassified Polynucleobacter TaxID=2640945 RepID=UPI001BFE7087|nr:MULTISPECIES: carboxymuconolactone decarboxylase family protein [unclassified Polynucleobacter]MBU3605391.1 carboxymuconolactone decarboxylase family protein [Polynucleobacter sp. MWH-Creno-3A4]QWD77567.1 carboxymuconolactone decarboxylase family protein [Polynucleobacter sp. MWH-Svant-W18]